MDKVASFISLLRGSKLNIVCLLDSFSDQKGKQRIDDLIKIKIIKDRNVRYFDEFVKLQTAKPTLKIYLKNQSIWICLIKHLQSLRTLV